MSQFKVGDRVMIPANGNESGTVAHVYESLYLVDVALDNGGLHLAIGPQFLVPMGAAPESTDIDTPTLGEVAAMLDDAMQRISGQHERGLAPPKRNYLQITGRNGVPSEPSIQPGDTFCGWEVESHDTPGRVYARIDSMSRFVQFYSSFELGNAADFEAAANKAMATALVQWPDRLHETDKKILFVHPDDWAAFKAANDRRSLPAAKAKSPVISPPDIKPFRQRKVQFGGQEFEFEDRQPSAEPVALTEEERKLALSKFCSHESLRCQTNGGTYLPIDNRIAVARVSAAVTKHVPSLGPGPSTKRRVATKKAGR